MMRDFLAGLPKAEVHLHIEGTIRPETKLRLAARNGVALKFATLDAMAAATRQTSDDPTVALRDFLTAFYDGLAVLVTEQDFFEVTEEFFQTCAAENVRHVDLSFDPQAHTSRGVSIETVLSGLGAAQERARARHGISSSLVLCINRDRTVESAFEALDQARPHRAKIAGLGLDSNEAGNPPEKFLDVYHRARSEGYRLTAHCDVDQEDALEHIRTCVEDLGVERIDHGINVVEDANLMATCAARGIGFTACPTWRAEGAPPRRVDRIRVMFDAGLRVSINSDDPALFPSQTLGHMLPAVCEATPFERHEAVMLMENAIRSAFIDETRIGELVGELHTYAKAFQEKT
ncbi:MAG: adenosine deaminase [Pseudomonadota bacterium]